MTRRPKHEIEITPDADDHIGALTARDRATVLDSLEAQLAYEPMVETRNRKPMRPNPVAPWELRLGHLRVYFEVEAEPSPMAKVLAVGIKERDKVRIGGKEVELK